MANLKFSGFTAAAAIDQTDSFLVGFDTDGGGANPTNNKWTFPEVAAGLAAVTATPFSIYAADGTVGSGRVATVTDTLTFNNSSNQNILKISNEVCIGQLAVANGNTTVAIGLDSRATGGSTTAVGSYARATNGSSSAFGHSAQTTKIGALVIGYYSKSLGDYGVSVGYACGAANGTAANVVNIGRSSKGEGANSITIASNGSSTAPTTANAFGVYMTSNTSADFEVVGSGTSTLRTNLNVTGNMEVDGQAWGDLYDGGTIADAGTYTPDWNNGNVQKITIVSGGGITIANGTNVNNGATYILIIEQAGINGTVTWAGKYRFPAGAAPTLTSGAGKADVITMIPYNATSVLCSSTLDFLTT